MLVRFYNGKELDCNFGMFTEGPNIGKLTYCEDVSIKEVLIDGKWLPNPGYDFEKFKKSQLLPIESRLLEIYKEKQICENNNLREKFNSLVIEQEKLEKQKEEIDAL